VHLFVVGAGHVGLVTGAGFVAMGHQVTVADVDAHRIAGLQAGETPIYEPGLDSAIRAGLADGSLVFTTQLDAPRDAAFSIVCVNTPTGPDGPLSTINVEAAVRTLLDATGPGHSIVVRSTLPLQGPDRLLAIAAGRPERAAVVTNPEFMREGQALRDFANPNRVIAGWLEPRDRDAADAVIALYAPLDAPSLVADARSVALIKLLSNVFLGMKIAYANEVARVADAIGADVDTVIAGVGLDERIGSAFMRPGPGFGGSCLPEQAVAIALQTASLDVEAPLLSAIHRANAVHQRQIVVRLEQLLGGSRSLAGARVALLGLAFKADTDDVRESPALALAAGLRERGAHVVGYDPRANGRARRADPELETAGTAAQAVADADAVVVATEWREFANLDWAALAAAMRGSIVYDTRAVVDVDAVRAAGLRLERLGRPGGEGQAGAPAPGPAPARAPASAPAAPSSASSS